MSDPILLIANIQGDGRLELKVIEGERTLTLSETEAGRRLLTFPDLFDACQAASEFIAELQAANNPEEFQLRLLHCQMVQNTLREVLKKARGEP